jgi:hypothetical protein
VHAAVAPQRHSLDVRCMCIWLTASVPLVDCYQGSLNEVVMNIQKRYIVYSLSRMKFALRVHSVKKKAKKPLKNPAFSSHF